VRACSARGSASLRDMQCGAAQGAVQLRGSAIEGQSRCEGQRDGSATEGPSPCRSAFVTSQRAVAITAQSAIRVTAHRLAASSASIATRHLAAVDHHQWPMRISRAARHQTPRAPFTLCAFLCAEKTPRTVLAGAGPGAAGAAPQHTPRVLPTRPASAWSAFASVTCSSEQTLSPESMHVCSAHRCAHSTQGCHLHMRHEATGETSSSVTGSAMVCFVLLVCFLSWRILREFSKTNSPSSQKFHSNMHHWFTASQYKLLFLHLVGRYRTKVVCVMIINSSNEDLSH
jgi:hypothetical protein